MKGNDFCLFAKNMGKNNGKNLRGKCSQKALAKKDITDALKANSKIFIQKTAEATGVLIGYKIGIKVTKTYKNFTNDCFTNRRKINRNTKKKIYISRKKGQNY